MNAFPPPSVIRPGPRILLVRLSAIGDMLHGLPVLCALREQAPEAHITWVVEGRTAELLEGHPALDQIIRLPRKWLKSPSAVWRLRRQLSSLAPDVAIDLQGLTKSALVAWLSGARRRIGFGGADGREISPWLNNQLVRPQKTHVIDRNLELLGPLGLHPGPARFDLPSWPDAAAAIERFLRERSLNRQFALLNPGAGWASKRWPPQRFAEVAAYLGQKRLLPTVVAWAGPEERRWADEIVCGSRGHAVLAPPTSLRELGELARRSCLFVGADTGPLHLAAAVGTPCLGLFGPVSAQRNGPYGPQHLALQNVLLTGGSRARRTADNASMRAISAEEVCDACDRLLARNQARPGSSVPAAHSGDDQKTSSRTLAA